MSVLYTLWGCGNLRPSALSPKADRMTSETYWHNIFLIMCSLSLDDLFGLVCLRSSLVMIGDDFSLCLFCDLLLPLPVICLSSLYFAPWLSLFLFLFLSGCVFSYFSWQVNRWFWSQWCCTFSPLSLSESILGLAVYRRCSLEALC